MDKKIGIILLAALLVALLFGCTQNPASNGTTLPAGSNGANQVASEATNTTLPSAGDINIGSVIDQNTGTSGTITQEATGTIINPGDVNVGDII